MTIVLFMAIFGWMSTALLIGLIIGKSAKMGDNQLQTRHIPPAQAWLPELDMPGDPDEKADGIISFPGFKRQKDEKGGSPQWDKNTVEKGVEELRAQYAQAGFPVSDKELREEVELMLNAEGGTIE